jgi:hypothetical protein
MDTENPQDRRKITSRENGKKGGRPRIAKLVKEGKSLKPLVPEINRQAYAELSRLASNLNQLARHLNSTGHKITAQESEAVYRLLQEIRAGLLGVKI